MLILGSALFLTRTLIQFDEAKVVTNILSTTEDLGRAKFPKIVMKNIYSVRLVINYVTRKTFSK